MTDNFFKNIFVLVSSLGIFTGEWILSFPKFAWRTSIWSWDTILSWLPRSTHRWLPSVVTLVTRNGCFSAFEDSLCLNSLILSDSFRRSKNSPTFGRLRLQLVIALLVGFLSLFNCLEALSIFSLKRLNHLRLFSRGKRFWDMSVWIWMCHSPGRRDKTSSKGEIPVDPWHWVLYDYVIISVYRLQSFECSDTNFRSASHRVRFMRSVCPFFWGY